MYKQECISCIEIIILIYSLHWWDCCSTEEVISSKVTMVLYRWGGSLSNTSTRGSVIRSIVGLQPSSQLQLELVKFLDVCFGHSSHESRSSLMRQLFQLLYTGVAVINFVGKVSLFSTFVEKVSSSKVEVFPPEVETDWSTFHFFVVVNDNALQIRVANQMMVGFFNNIWRPFNTIDIRRPCISSSEWKYPLVTELVYQICTVLRKDIFISICLLVIVGNKMNRSCIVILLINDGITYETLHQCCRCWWRKLDVTLLF